jgi:chitinase
VSGATGYRVYEGTSVVATATGTSATIGGLATCSSHSYSVAAFNAGAESAKSGTVSASTTGCPPAPGIAVAPYVDMGAWPTPVLTDLVIGGNLRSLTLAFITASGCKAMWFNAFDPRQAWGRDQVDAVRARGGDVKISFGGATGIELAQSCTTVAALQAEYQAVVSAYNLRYIDLDIEGAATADPASVNRRSQALAALQRANPGLKVSLTLPVLPEGLTADGLSVVRSARDNGVELDMVNVMAMDYYRNGDYGDFAVQAANSTFAQVKSLYPARTDAQVWKMVAVTPMLGQNDDGRVFDQADARQLVTFAGSRHLGMLSFWETTRDRNACTGALYRCTNIPQQPYEFSRTFAGYTG